MFIEHYEVCDCQNMVKGIFRPYHFKKVLKADLHFGGWTEVEETLIADLIIACMQRGYPADLEALSKYAEYIIQPGEEQRRYGIGADNVSDPSSD